MSYSPSFEPTYPGGWEDRPSQNTPAMASTFTGYDSAITNIETFLDGSTAIKPVAKTSGMTQQVGVDENGALFTTPGGGGGGGAAEDITYDNTQSGLTASDVQGAIDELAEGGGGGTAATTTYDNTTSHLTADDVQDAIDEVVSNISDLSTSVSGKVSKSGDTISGNLSVLGTLTLANGFESSEISASKMKSGYNGYVSSGSHAEGYNCSANTEYSHAEGFRCETTGSAGSGSYSHAEGKETTTYGDASHAEGYGTTASGNYSHTEGIGTQAQSEGQTVCGKYNDNDSNNLFEVGNGALEFGEITRSNALEVRQDGSVKVGTEIDCDTVTTLANTDYVYVSVYDENLYTNVMKKITIANLKTVLGI